MPSSGDVVEAGFRHPGVLVTAQRILDAGPAVVHVVPLTTTIRRFDSEIVVTPDQVNGLASVSAAQCQHLRAVSTNRIRTVRGNVGHSVLAQLRETLAVILDLP